MQLLKVMITNSWLQLLKYGNLYDNITMSRCPDHSFATRYCNKRLCMVLLLNGVASHDLSPPCTMSWFSPGGPLATKRTIHGSHIVGPGGTIYSNTICSRWSGGPVVAGDHLRRDIRTIYTNFGFDSKCGVFR